MTTLYDTDDKTEELICPHCTTTMCGVEYGNQCETCPLFVGDCQHCGSQQSTLIKWTADDFDESLAPDVVRYDDDDKYASTVNFHSESTDAGGEYKRQQEVWYAPPCRLGEQFDDSAKWLFRCNQCGKYTEAYCD